MGNIDAIIKEIERKKDQYNRYLTLGPAVDEKIKLIENEIAELSNKKYNEKIEEVNSQIKKLLGTDSELDEKYLDENVERLEKEIRELNKKNKKLEKENKTILVDLNQVESELSELSDTFNTEQIDGKSFTDLLKNKDFLKQVESIEEDQIKTVVEILEALCESKIEIPAQILHQFSIDNKDLITYLDDELRKLL